MARKWLNLFTGAALSFAVAGNALADEGENHGVRRRITD